MTTGREIPAAPVGLSIVAEVARAHGGIARLEKSAVGARFIVVLPAVEVTDANGAEFDVKGRAGNGAVAGADTNDDANEGPEDDAGK